MSLVPKRPVLILKYATVRSTTALGYKEKAPKSILRMSWYTPCNFLRIGSCDSFWLNNFSVFQIHNSRVDRFNFMFFFLSFFKLSQRFSYIFTISVVKKPNLVQQCFFLFQKRFLFWLKVYKGSNFISSIDCRTKFRI